ncbi:MAG TPA: hydrogenase maturation protease [Acidobacteriaceae bacterium]|nr:hydrogenase maturation protease [Acidobacteriaceae bacterium]
MREWEWQLLEEKAALDHIDISGVAVRKGDRVRLCPRDGGDIMDLALKGQIATIEGIEEDYEGKCHVCVVLDDDPGRDLGFMRQPGHRFFFDPAEVELLPAGEEEQQLHGTKVRVLIAGIGNIFLGDDGFGVEVARRLANCELPAEVRVVDFGIRGLDLVYALQDGYETTILVDAFPHGKAPGTVSVVEPDLNDLETSSEQSGFIEPHGMNPMNVLRMARAMQAPLERILLIGCEPAYLGGDEGHMGLSEPVEAAVNEAMKTVQSLVARILDGSPLSAKD